MRKQHNVFAAVFTPCLWSGTGMQYIVVAICASLIVLAACTSPAPTTPDNSSGVVRRGCDHCRPPLISYEDGSPPLAGSTATSLKTNLDQSILSFKLSDPSTNGVYSQHFYDLQENRQWQSWFSGQIIDSLLYSTVIELLDWSPYDPDVALVWVLGRTFETSSKYRWYTQLAFCNVRDPEVLELIGSPIPGTRQFVENSGNVTWLKSSQFGNDTIAFFYSAMFGYTHVQSGQRLQLPRALRFDFESTKASHRFSRLSSMTLISGLYLRCLHDSNARVLAHSWSPDARYLSLVVRNLNYDSVGRNPKDTVFYQTWPCNNTELWVFDVDQLLSTRNLGTTPTLRTNLQESLCMFLPPEPSIASTKRGALLMHLRAPLTERSAIYELSLNGEILRKVVDTP